MLSHGKYKDLQTEFQRKIDQFITINNIFKKPIQKLIQKMLNDTEYINGQSLERHDWGYTKHDLDINIPINNISDKDLDDIIIRALKKNDIDDTSIIEILWGDIQLGKRIHAMIIMWFSIYILKRPVLYIFRNLTIDQTQLMNDINSPISNIYSFKKKYMADIFEEFHEDILKEYGVSSKDEYHNYALPSLTTINSQGSIDKLSNKDQMSDPRQIFCCLMNDKQLEKINRGFNINIKNNKQLVNVTLLVDESDLFAPTAPNIKTEKKIKEAAKCEKLLAKIYMKVKYALHITGTAHSLLYNTTTLLSKNSDIQMKISKIHKMKRRTEYYGLFSGDESSGIQFNTDNITSWWSNKKYNIIDDYNNNIQKIIRKIDGRKNVKYNSFLINEEKKRASQFSLVEKIMYDFKNIIIIVFHGGCLELYVPKKILNAVLYYSQYDAEKSRTKRLYKEGGVYHANYEQVQDHYRFKIKTRKKDSPFNIKQVYKLLAMLFKDEKNKLTSNIKKTIITITGKYGERGYSFTSDDYGEYQLHLTDQYYPCHTKNKNMTNVSQSLRLQGKYSDTPTLTLWTTTELRDIIKIFYVPFIKMIEKEVMNCEDNDDIVNVIESIIDTGMFKFNKYIRYLAPRRHMRNIKINKHYDKKYKGHILIDWTNLNSVEINNWVKERNLPTFNCINEIKSMPKQEFIKNYGTDKITQDFIPLNNNVSVESLCEKINIYNKKKGTSLNPPTEKWFNERKEGKRNDGIWRDFMRGVKNIRKYTYEEIEKQKSEGLGKSEGPGKIKRHRYNFCYYDKSFGISVRYGADEKELPKQTNDVLKKTPYVVNGYNVIYSKLKEIYTKKNTDHGYINEGGGNFIDDSLPEKYYWKSPDGWLIYYDKSKKDEIFSIDISRHENDNDSGDDIENESVKEFITNNITPSQNPRLRTGLSGINRAYKEYCRQKNIKPLKQLVLKTILNDMGVKKGTQVDGKRGYNIEIINNI
mgnify:CR=1 FL=1